MKHTTVHLLDKIRSTSSSNLLVSEVQLCIKVIKIVRLSSNPDTSVSRAPDFKSQGCGFESHCGQEFFILYFVAFDALLAGRLVPCK